MSSMFHFKQFSIDQANCAMKVNTDGVLVAALADFEDAANILDVGTGTGLIALMLAQKYNNAFIDAIEIDKNAAVTALKNFSDSPFSNRIKLFPVSVKDYFEKVNQKYDLIISNPPFFINSLSSVNPRKRLARHTDLSFFDFLLTESVNHLKQSGHICVILPLETAAILEKILKKLSVLKIQKEILIHSFSDSKPHRIIIVMGFENSGLIKDKFVIYESKGIYTGFYRNLLKDFLTIF
jgi:tRNA1Val (adenine37-N6)-methyltransferase